MEKVNLTIMSTGQFFATAFCAFRFATCSHKKPPQKTASYMGVRHFMSCILRVSGKDFDVEKFSKLLPIDHDSIWIKDEPRFPGSKKLIQLNTSSGIRFLVSNADFSEFSTQLDDAILYLTEHKSTLKILATFTGIDHVVLDFGAEIHPPGWVSFTWPPELMLLAGELRIYVTISLYPVSSEEE